MVKTTPFNEIHLKLMIELWNKKKVSISDYFKMLTDIGINESDMSVHPRIRQYNRWSVYRIENSETSLEKDILCQNLSKLVSHIVFEKINGKDFLASVEPSPYLCNWLWNRSRNMEYKEMGWNNIADPILEKISEVSELFNKYRSKFVGRVIPGEEFLLFLEENNISPYIWFWDYFDRPMSGGSSTILCFNQYSGNLPFSFKLRVDRSEEKVFKKAKSLAERSVVRVVFI